MCELQRKTSGPYGGRPVTVGVGALRRGRPVVGAPGGQDGRLEAGLRVQLGRGRRPLVHRGRPLGRGRRRARLPLLRRRAANATGVSSCCHSTCMATVQFLPCRPCNLFIHSWCPFPVSLYPNPEINEIMNKGYFNVINLISDLDAVE